MSRGKNKKVKDLLVDAIVLLDVLHTENKQLKMENDSLSKQVKELDKKSVGIKQRVLNLFS